MYPVVPADSYPNASNNYSISDLCEDFKFTTGDIISPVISGIGLILNILNILVFNKTPKQIVKGDMVKYLIAKSVFDLCYCLIIILESLTEINSDSSFYYYIFKWCILLYFRHVTIFLSIAFDCLAIVSRDSLITKRIQWTEKIIVFNRGMPIFTAIGLLIYSYKFAFYKIVPYTFIGGGGYYNISTEGQFILGNGELSAMDYIRIELFQTSIVNGIFPSIILIFNTLTAFEIIQTMRNKRRLSTSKSIHNKIKRSEIRNTTMLILSSPLTILPNFIFFLVAILVQISPTQFYNACFDNIGNILFYSQFSFSFLFYFVFNVNFQKNLKKLILVS